MPSAQFLASVHANIAYWRDHSGLDDRLAWGKLDRERGNLFRAVVFGLQHDETWPEAAGLTLNCFAYIFERGYWSEWAVVLEQALVACPEGDLAVKARMLNQLGSLYRRERRLDDALDAHKRAEELGRALSDTMLIAQSQLGLGRVYRRRGQYDLADQYANQAVTAFSAPDMPPQYPAHAHNLLGVTALGRGNYEVAANQLFRACNLFRKAMEPIELGRSEVNLCEALARLDRVDEALELFEEAATIFAQHGHQLELTRLYVNLGFLHYSQDDLVEAEAAFRKAYAPNLRRFGPIYLRSQIESNLGNVLLLQGHIEEARTYFLSAVAGFRLAGARTMLANSLDGLAETTLATGDRQEGISLYEEALAIVEALPEDAFAKRMEIRFVGLLEELKSSTEEVEE
jgi:tetratricopeptide (TPR) repeat protein